MADNGSLPKPAGAEDKKLSATERAKLRARPPVGGVAPVQMPNFADAVAMAKDKAERSEPENRPPQPAGQGMRSPEEIKADMEKLNNAVKEYGST